MLDPDPAQDPLQRDGNEVEMWCLYTLRRDPALRQRLIQHYLPYARMHAATLYAGRFGDAIEFGDYFQLASLALVEAIDRFDAGRGVKFQTFAAYRIRGAILDGVESLTERHRQIAARRRIQQSRLASLMDASGDSGRVVLAQLAEIGIGLALGYLLEDSGMIAEGEPTGQPGPLPQYAEVELLQLRRSLLEAVAQLPDQHRQVIAGHYLQAQPFEQIAAELGLSKGRISQVHKAALLSLRQRLG